MSRAAHWFLVGMLMLTQAVREPLHACSPVYRESDGQYVLNADQTVIILWDPQAKRQHFIRQASFDATSTDFGFLIPSPTQPELEEAGNEAFGLLKQITAPTVVHHRPSSGFGCSSVPPQPLKAARSVEVLEQKRVAGFDAVVLQADSADALVAWLEEHGYAYSPEVAAWAKPYIEQHWKITALKVAKNPDDAEKPLVSTAALRMSFDTDRPLFPYREPDYKKIAGVTTKRRLLRTYFISDTRYRGKLTPETPWTGRAVWAGRLSTNQKSDVCTKLQLPENVGPNVWYLTEFEDPWPYRLAPADVYFAKDDRQENIRRPDIIATLPPRLDGTLVGLAGLLIIPWFWRRRQSATV